MARPAHELPTSNNSEARGDSVPFQGHINEQVVEQAFGLEQF